MDNVRPHSYGAAAPQETDAPFRSEQLDHCPTPGEIVGQIGRVIAVCLGLGLLAQLLVAVVGIY